jgi:hypothetical protein
MLQTNGNTIDLRGTEQVCTLSQAIDYAGHLQYEMVIFGKHNDIHDVPPNSRIDMNNPLLDDYQIKAIKVLNMNIKPDYLSTKSDYAMEEYILLVSAFATIFILIAMAALTLHPATMIISIPVGVYVFVTECVTSLIRYKTRVKYLTEHLAEQEIEL